MKQRKEKENPFKVLLLGDSSVGKTSIIQWFKKHNDYLRSNTENTFSKTHYHSPSKENLQGISPTRATVAPDIVNLTYVFKYENDVVKELKLNIWDTVGHEIHDGENLAHTTITKMLLRDADVVIFCFDITKRETLTHILEKWKKIIGRSHQKNRIWYRNSSKLSEEENEIELGGNNLEKEEKENEEDEENLAFVKSTCLFYLVCNKIDLSPNIVNNLKIENIFLVDEKPLMANSGKENAIKDQKINDFSNYCLTLKIPNLTDNENLTKSLSSSSLSRTSIMPKLSLKKKTQCYINNVSNRIGFNYEEKQILSYSSSHEMFHRTKRDENTSTAKTRSLSTTTKRPRSISISISSSSSSSSSSFSSTNKNSLNFINDDNLLHHQIDYNAMKKTGQYLFLNNHDYNEIFFISSRIERSFGIEHLFEFICVDLLNLQQSLNNNQIDFTSVENKDTILEKFENKSNCCV